MTRKSPNRAGETSKPPLTRLRIADLAHIISEPGYALGPQDEADLIEVCLECVERRCAEALIDSAKVADNWSAA